MTIAIGVLIIIVALETYYIIENYSNYKDVQKKYDANVQGFLLTKSDRINGRIEQYASTVKKQTTTIDIKDFAKFVKSVQILIAQELSIKGNTVKKH